MATYIEEAETEVVALRSCAGGDPGDEVGPGAPALRRREVTVLDTPDRALHEHVFRAGGLDGCAVLLLQRDGCEHVAGVMDGQ